MEEVATMFVDIQGAKIYFEDAGTGVPTLFLHGIPDSGLVWDEVTRALRSSVRCIVPDLPGFGQSGVPDGFDVTLDKMAAFVDAFLVAAGITEPVNLVVHDVGGPFGLAWAVRHPRKVNSLAIMNTIFHPDYHWHRYGRLCRTPILGELLQLLTTQSGLARSLRSNSGLTKPSREHIHATYGRFTSTTRKMVLRLYRGLDPQVFEWWDVRQRALAAAVPSLVLWGDQDTYIGKEYAARFGAGTVKHFHDAGHWLMVESPEVVSTNLLELFRDAATRSRAREFGARTK